jgi:hypothetical protein
MDMPFPGIDPYLEHPVLWEGLHARLVVAVANQLQPRLDPRYIASVEERVFIEGPQRRIPDVWVQKSRENGGSLAAVAEPEEDTAVVLEVENLEIHESRIEILDAYNGMKLVTMIEVVSPTNKIAGPGRQSYVQKQQEALSRDCHLVELDLLRRGRHVLAIPRWRTRELKPYEYLACVTRYPQRNRFSLYPCRLHDRLPRIMIPLADPDADVPLDLHAALAQVYHDGRYLRRIRYDSPCVPRLKPQDQEWANNQWAAYKAAHPDLFPAPPS